MRTAFLIVNVCLNSWFVTQNIKGQSEENILKDTLYLWPENSQNNVTTPLSDKPLIEIWYPDKINEKLPCILVCPGGGYTGVSYDLEGKPYAELFTQKGYVCAILIYRVYPNLFPAPYSDACRAIRLLKFNGANYSIDSSRIAILGSSAGGHIVTTVATRPALYFDPEDDLINSASASPKCHIAVYPVISFVKNAHNGSIKGLLGEDVSEEKMRLFSNELHVNSQTPPLFLYHNDKDPTVPVENSLMYAAAFSEKNISFALHIYPYNTHAEGIANNIPEINSWTALLLDWLKINL